VGIACIPIYFYVQAKRLLWPSLKDLIEQRRIHYHEIKGQLNPKARKIAHDAMK